ncbi:MAG: oligosaccharide flippase family protein [bacterium]|nr:oligosaccharide flippase family protein [bacterium]
MDVGSYLVGYALVGVIMALLGFGVLSLVAAMLGQGLIRSLMLLLLNRHPIKPLFSLFHSRKLLHFGGGYTLAGIMNYIANVEDNFIIGKTLGVGALGLYARAYQLMQLPATYFGLAIQKVSLPALSKLQDDIPRFARTYFTSAAVVVLVCIPLTVLVVVIAPEIVAVLLGEKWSGVVDPFRILGLGIFFRTAYKIDHSTSSALGAVYKRSLVDFTYAVAVLVAAVTGLRWGISGVAAGVLFAIILNWVLSVSLSLRLLKRSWAEILHLMGPGLILGSVVALIALPARFTLVNAGSPAVIVLTLTPLLSALGLLAIVATKPRVLGAHGVLVLRAVLDAAPVRFVPRLIRQWAGTKLKEV